jgi:hypothetical protein
MSEQNQAEFNEDDSNSNANLAFCAFCNGNGKELMNELKWKVANLEVTKNLYFMPADFENSNSFLQAKNQLFEATNKHLEEKLKHFEEKQIQEKKYSELEAKMRNLEVNHNHKCIIQTNKI